MRLSVPIFRLKRQARLLAREKKIPLHQALDQVAQHEGFRSWSHLADSASHDRPATKILSQLTPGDLVLIGARPGQGKTLLGLELAAEAAKLGVPGFFFTLEDNEEVVLSRLKSLGTDPEALRGALTLDTSDDICAGYIIQRLRAAPGNAVTVIDYLQLLDQKRRNPELTDQIQALKLFAIAAKSIIIAISQIDRSFERKSSDSQSSRSQSNVRQAKRLPNLSDVRLPNPLDLTLFTKTCFMHEGEVRLETVA
jgi:replicative DNA helicase